MANSHIRRAMGKPPVKGLSSSNRWSSLAMLQAEEGDQDDWLSKLPDDILVNIVERLDTADAAKTAILSPRWKHIPAMLAKICLSVGSFDPGHDRSQLTCEDVVRANATVLEATRSMLQNRTISLYTIRLLFMQFFLGDGSINIGQTVADTTATQKVESAEFSLLTEKACNQCDDDDLLSYGRQLRSFVDACPDTFVGLTRLKLENVFLGESDFTQICSICKRLEFLRLYNCGLETTSLLELEHPQLCELEINRCDFESIDLNWLPKLTTLNLSCWESQHDPVSFGYVPLLQTVIMTNTALVGHKMLKLREFLGKATISDLHLNFQSEKIWVKPEGPRELSEVFHKLRRVNLVNISEECDLAWTLFILHGAPSLKELSIKVWDLCAMIRKEELRKMLGMIEEKKDPGLEWEAPGSGFKHHNLAVLRIFGFQLEEKFEDYISSVMEAAVNLKDIYLYERPLCGRCRRCKRKRRKDRYPWIKKHRISFLNSLPMDMCPLLRIHFPSLRT